MVADGLHQVGLAEADAAVEEQRVVASRGVLGHRPAGGVGELVGAADDEVVELIARVELRRRDLAGSLVDREEDLERRLLHAGDGSVDRRPVTLFQSAQETAVWSDQDQPVLLLGAHL